MTSSTTATTAMIALFADVLRMERLDKTLTALAIYGSDCSTRERNIKARRVNRDKFNAAQEAWTLDTLRAYAEYRKAN